MENKFKFKEIILYNGIEKQIMGTFPEQNFYLIQVEANPDSFVYNQEKDEWDDRHEIDYSGMIHMKHYEWIDGNKLNPTEFTKIVNKMREEVDGI